MNVLLLGPGPAVQQIEGDDAECSGRLGAGGGGAAAGEPGHEEGEGQESG
jgi:hypothetical protein